MRTLERPIRWTALLLASGTLVACAGGTMPVSYFHPGGGDIGSLIARQGRQFPGTLSTGTADPATAAVSGGRAVGIAAGNFNGVPASAAHATGATAGHGGGTGAAGGHG